MVDLIDNFLDLMKLFLAVESDFMKSLKRRIGGGKEKKIDGSATGQSRERSAKKAETKAFPNREHYKKYLIEKALPPT
jgi:hypothetical protein